MKIDVMAKIRIIDDNSGTEVQNDFSQFVSGDFYMILKEYQEWKPYPRDKFMLLLEDCLTGKYHSDSSVHPLNNITARQMVLLLNGFASYGVSIIQEFIRCR